MRRAPLWTIRSRCCEAIGPPIAAAPSSSTARRTARWKNCFIDQVGGNAIFVNNYNRRVVVRGSQIAKAGANGVAFVGDPAVRNPLFEYGQTQSVKNIDLKPGPQTDNYPSDCLVEDCLIYLTGPGREADRPGADLHGEPNHGAPLLDLRRAAGRHQHSATAAGAGTSSSSATCSTR